MREPFRTTFLSTTVAAPPARVWPLLAGGTTTAGMLPGISVTSAWATGSPVLLEVCGCTAHGEVLRAVAPHRLSYTLGAPGPDAAAPTVVVTWEMRPGPGTRTTIDLTVDDLEPGCEDDELRAGWWQVLRTLAQRVDALPSADLRTG